MRAYVKAAGMGTNVTLVDIDSGEKFSVPAGALQKLFGVVPEQDEVWEFRASRLDDVTDAFRKWEAVRQA